MTQRGVGAFIGAATRCALLAACVGFPAQAQRRLSPADSALVGRILLAEDRRDSTDASLLDGSRHADSRIRLLAQRARGRIVDPHFAGRDSLPALPAPKAWPEPAWRLRYRALTAQRENCAALATALSDSAWPVRLRAADLAPAACSANEPLTATLRAWIDALPRDAASRPPGGVSWHAAAHAIVALEPRPVASAHVRRARRRGAVRHAATSRARPRYE
jgi:hypothetical protein